LKKPTPVEVSAGIPNFNEGQIAGMLEMPAQNSKQEKRKLPC
jgi:hypothetical protein